MDQEIDRSFDEKNFPGHGMWQLERDGLNEHPCAGTQEDPKLITWFKPDVAIVPHNGMSKVDEMAADLMKASGLGLSLEEGQIVSQVLDDSKLGFGRLCDGGFAPF